MYPKIPRASKKQLTFPGDTSLKSGNRQDKGSGGRTFWGRGMRLQGTRRYKESDVFEEKVRKNVLWLEPSITKFRFIGLDCEAPEMLS